jgi:hypothetical protein
MIDNDALDAIVDAIVAPLVDASHPEHVHRCGWEREESGEVHDGTCRCTCGAVLAMGPTFASDGHWAWKLVDGTYATFPDPRWKHDSATL